jgi:septum formation protein
MMIKLNRNLVLASQSPRRAELLNLAGFSFEIRVIEVDESVPSHLPAPEIAEYIAAQKMEAQKPYMKSGELIITADSVVVLNNKVFGKPKDAPDAFHMIGQLAGNAHQVYTGVCMMDEGKFISFTDATEVWMERMSDDEIWQYIQIANPMDKAGAYGIQDWIGYTKVISIKGSYANVMGLPVHRVYDILLTWDNAEYASY